MQKCKRIISKKHIKEQGFILVTVLLLLVLITLIGFTLSYKIISTIKISGLTKMGMVRFYGAEGGTLSVTAYMTNFKRTDAPLDVTLTSFFKANIKVLGDTIRYPVGYGTLWKGADIQINSVSPPPPNDRSEVEAVVFIPVSPVGYGNE
jgi:hypothetical protein